MQTSGDLAMANWRGWRVVGLIGLILAAYPLLDLMASRSGDEPRSALGTVIDLTHVLQKDIPVYPGGEPFRLESVMTIEKSKLFNINRFSMGEHTGTHVDAPSHAASGGASAESLTWDQLIGPLALVNVTTPPLANADYAVSVRDIRTWEDKHGVLPRGAFVIARTGWGRYWSEPRKYVNADDKKVPHFPGFSAEAIHYLVGERAIRGVGIDTLSIDVGSSATFDAHKVLMGAGKVGIENLANLDKVPATGATLLAAPLKIGMGSGSPARILAILPPGK